ncbi:ribonuclease domain-containing protein [Gordonia sp. CPCC 206044]
MSVAGLVVIAVVAVVTWVVGGGSDDSATNSGSSSAATSIARDAGSSTVPDHVLRTLAFIDAGDWPEAADAPGTQGGATFRNNERMLPVTTAAGSRIAYREWDVNAKERGRSRDAERIVTGNDGTAWYTDDHYRSFVQIRGPSR